MRTRYAATIYPLLIHLQYMYIPRTSIWITVKMSIPGISF